MVPQTPFDWMPGIELPHWPEFGCGSSVSPAWQAPNAASNAQQARCPSPPHAVTAAQTPLDWTPGNPFPHCPEFAWGSSTSPAWQAPKPASPRQQARWPAPPHAVTTLQTLLDWMPGSEFAHWPELICCTAVSPAWQAPNAASPMQQPRWSVPPQGVTTAHTPLDCTPNTEFPHWPEFGWGIWTSGLWHAPKPASPRQHARWPTAPHALTTPHTPFDCAPSTPFPQNPEFACGNSLRPAWHAPKPASPTQHARWPPAPQGVTDTHTLLDCTPGNPLPHCPEFGCERCARPAWHAPKAASPTQQARRPAPPQGVTCLHTPLDCVPFVAFEQ